MSETSIKLENVSLNFPRSKAFLGSIEQSLGIFLNLKKSVDNPIAALNQVSFYINEGEVVGVSSQGALIILTKNGVKEIYSSKYIEYI